MLDDRPGAKPARLLSGLMRAGIGPPGSVCLVLFAATLFMVPEPSALQAQEGAGSARATEPGPPVSTEGLASGPYATMNMLYERTIFAVDVMVLTLRFGPETAGEFRKIVEGEEYDELIAQRVVDAAVDSRDVLVESRFVRGIGYEQYMDGIYRNLADALEAGYIDQEEHREIVTALPEQYSPLEEPGIEKGGIMWYRIDGDDFHVVYEAPDGELLIDVSAHGSHRRRATLGGYLAEDSDFREGLIRSLFEEDER